jgi:hypothetical protein
MNLLLLSQFTQHRGKKLPVLSANRLHFAARGNQWGHTLYWTFGQHQPKLRF